MTPVFTIVPPFRGTDREQMEQAFAVRRAVFIEEQRVPEEEELDEHDAGALHWLAMDERGAAIATARLLEPEPGVAKIGRVAVLQTYRGSGIGRALMIAILEEARRRGFHQAKLDSQVHALPFYERLGFAAYGDEFLDANIPHRHMVLALS